MSVIFTRGKTTPPGKPISSKTLGGIASASTSARGGFGGNLFGLRNAGGAGGFIPRLKSYKSNRATVTTYKPFHIFASYNTDTSQMDVTLYPGSCNGQLPSNMFDTLHCSNSGLFYVTLSVSTDGKQVTGTTIEIGSTNPSPPSAQLGAGPSSFSVILGLVSSGVGYDVFIGNMLVSLVEVLRVDKVSPSPNTLPYSSYYTFSSKVSS